MSQGEEIVEICSFFRQLGSQYSFSLQILQTISFQLLICSANSSNISLNQGLNCQFLSVDEFCSFETFEMFYEFAIFCKLH